MLCSYGACGSCCNSNITEREADEVDGFTEFELESEGQLGHLLLADSSVDNAHSIA